MKSLLQAIEDFNGVEARKKILDLRDINLNKSENLDKFVLLADLIKQSKTLIEILFTNTHLGSVPMEKLIPVLDAIHMHDGPLTINLAANDFGEAPELFQQILDVLLKSNIESLDLSLNKLRHLRRDTLTVLSFGIENVFLRELSLRDNELGSMTEENLLLIEGLFSNCKRLRSLDLGGNKLGKNTGLPRFLLDLSKLPIEQLDFCGNGLDSLFEEREEDYGRRCIELLTQHPTVTTLSLADNLLCAWGTDYLDYFFQRILEQHRLRKLDLDTNHFMLLEKMEPEKGFIEKFSAFVREAAKFSLQVSYERCNFAELTNVDSIVAVSGVQPTFWHKMHSQSAQSEVISRAGMLAVAAWQKDPEITAILSVIDEKGRLPIVAEFVRAAMSCFSEVNEQSNLKVT